MVYHNWYKYTIGEIYSQLGVHAGHSKENSILEASWMLYAFRQRICLINLDKTIHFFKLGLALAVYVGSIDQPFWFVNKNFTFRRHVKSLAYKCGEFSSTQIWIHGMASNFNHVSFGYFRRLDSSGFPKTNKFINFSLNYSNWIFTRFVRPKGVFVSSVYSNQSAVRDCLSGRVPCVGILDTNARSGNCLLPIPANDDSMECMVFYNSLFSEMILYKKFSYLILWYYYVKNFSRKISFGNWFQKKSALKLNSLNSLFTQKFRNSSTFFNFALTFLNGMNSAFGHVVQKLTIISKKLLSTKDFFDFSLNVYNQFLAMYSPMITAKRPDVIHDIYTLVRNILSEFDSSFFPNVPSHLKHSSLTNFSRIVSIKRSKRFFIKYIFDYRFRFYKKLTKFLRLRFLLIKFSKMINKIKFNKKKLLSKFNKFFSNICFFLSYFFSFIKTKYLIEFFLFRYMFYFFFINHFRNIKSLSNFYRKRFYKKFSGLKSYVRKVQKRKKYIVPFYSFYVYNRFVQNRSVINILRKKRFFFKFRSKSLLSSFLSFKDFFSRSVIKSYNANVKQVFFYNKYNWKFLNI